jgi:hypothetical protein
MFDEQNQHLIDNATTSDRLPRADGVANPAQECPGGGLPGPEQSVGGDQAGANGAGPDSAGNQRYADAGRKGARRIHQLIQQGRLYEQEHGLKRGRQRLRQLIEEGKLYEQEHGLAAGRKPRGLRLSRLSREQVLLTLLESLVRMVKPSFRGRLKHLLAALDSERN